MPKRLAKYFGYICKNFCRQDPSKFVKSSHTGRCPSTVVIGAASDTTAPGFESSYVQTIVNCPLLRYPETTKRKKTWSKCGQNFLQNFSRVFEPKLFSESGWTLDRRCSFLVALLQLHSPSFHLEKKTNIAGH